MAHTPANEWTCSTSLSPVCCVLIDSTQFRRGGGTRGDITGNATVEWGLLASMPAGQGSGIHPIVLETASRVRFEDRMMARLANGSDRLSPIAIGHLK